MRMTNKIMQNNSLYNINNNKVLQDKLSTQMSTQKKITRPSDDPIVAIRALRLRTSVSELTQFQERNAPDAEKWLDVTAGALSTVTEVLTEMSKQANKAANKDLEPSDIQIITEQLKLLRDEFYSTGNTDYAGRYVFTGYRTDTTMSFTETVEDDMPIYSITEQNTIGDFDVINYTNVGNLEGMNLNNYTDPARDVSELDVSNGDIHRLRLAYDDLEKLDKIEIMSADGKTVVNNTFPCVTVSLSTVPNPYQQALASKDAVIFIPETGEMLLGDTAYKTLESAMSAVNGTDTEIRITYEKDEWKNGDLRPEHYFACKTLNADKTDKIVYNKEYLDDIKANRKNNQVIEYDVGYNQTIRVNTTADEVFSHNLDRDIDDLELALKELTAINDTKKDLEAKLKSMQEGESGYADLKEKYDAADKAYSYIRENVHNMMGHAISKIQGYLDDANLAVTDNGTRSQRLDLISNRLVDQKTTFKTLQSENEDADIAEVAVQLTSTELTYEAALMATGKIMQTSLMNYI